MHENSTPLVRRINLRAPEIAPVVRLREHLRPEREERPIEPGFIDPSEGYRRNGRRGRRRWP